MKKVMNFLKKHYKFFVILGIIIVLVQFYFYITEPYYRLSTYIMNHYRPIEHRELKIDYDWLDSGEMYYKIYNETSTDFKILQLTDLHIGGSRASYYNDIKALNAMYQLIDYTKPDLIVLTGDMLFVSFLSRTVNNLSAAADLKNFMSNIGIPWTIVFGNHDSEFYNLYDDSELRGVFLAGEEKALLNPTYVENNEDTTDQMILICNEDNDVNTALLLMDSKLLTENSNISIDWYNKIIDKVNQRYQKNVPSMLFMHYPLYEYQEAYQLYEENGKDVKYFYGKKRENICFEERTNFFDKVLEKNSTKAIFVGHDHLNDFSLEYKGVRLTYGKSIDYITYKGIGKKTEQRGGTLITLKEDSSFEIEPIKLDDIMK